MKYNEYELISTYESLDNIKDQLETDLLNKNALDNSYLFNKFVSICTKKGNKKMAYKQVFTAFNLIKQFFRFNALFFLKMAVVNIEPFIFLHKIPRGNKEIIFPRILPIQTRIHNALYIIAKQAFNTRTSFRYLYISLAYSIIDNCMSNNIYNKNARKITEVAEQHKRNIKHTKKEKGKQLFSKIRRYERFKLFKKIKIWK